MKPKVILRPTILDRYLLKEIASPFLIALVLFTFVLLIPHLAEISDMLVGKSATWTVIGKLIFNILPSFLALTIPMAFLLAVLLGLGRLASESELVAMQAVGVSPLFLLRSLALLGVLATGATYYVHAFWVPDANQTYRETAFALAISRAQSVRPRVFIEDLLPHRSLYLGARTVPARRPSSTSSPASTCRTRARLNSAARLTNRRRCIRSRRPALRAPSRTSASSPR